MKNKDINKPLDREAKIMLLQILQRGFFTQDDINYLHANHYVPALTIIKTYEGCPDDMQEEDVY
ncbi:hypothetical protein [Dysgonomonas termitidis]|uniref:Uncharacterized protein n=1 Tax=Dysgonomonas termitidis TaxID=1516126 RepID=A0ABV9L1R7_9BACT